jgi:hypothetical protein
MGRHSAPDKEEPDEEPATLTLVREAGSVAGRHAIDDDEQATVVIEPAEPDLPAQTAADADAPGDSGAVVEAARPAAPEPAEPDTAAEQKGAAKAARGESNTRADLRMLRQNRGLRLQCLLVVVIAFGAYTAVMLGLNRTGDTYLRWIWIPIVLSGVLVGACLDLAHRRATRKSGSVAETADETSASSAPSSTTTDA